MREVGHVISVILLIAFIAVLWNPAGVGGMARQVVDGFNSEARP